MDELELTRRLLDDHEVDSVALERIRSRVRAAIDRERPGDRRRPWRVILAAAATIGIAVAVAVGLLMPTSREAAASELRRLGAIAEAQPPIRPGPGEFLLIRWEELRQEGFTGVGTQGSWDVITRLSVETWAAVDGSAFRREVVLSSTFASEADRLAWIQAGSPRLDLPRTHEFPPEQSPVHDVEALSETPGRLLDALRSGQVEERPPGDDQTFILIGELLAQGNAPPRVRAALFEVAARLEGVRSVGEVQDPLGRSGSGVEIAGRLTTRLVFDRDSAQLLAIELYEGGVEEGEQPSSWIATYPTIVVEEAPRLEAE